MQRRNVLSISVETPDIQDSMSSLYLFKATPESFSCSLREGFTVGRFYMELTHFSCYPRKSERFGGNASNLFFLIKIIKTCRVNTDPKDCTIFRFLFLVF